VFKINVLKQLLENAEAQYSDLISIAEDGWFGCRFAE
jgi:hypothetical protein